MSDRIKEGSDTREFPLTPELVKIVRAAHITNDLSLSDEAVLSIAQYLNDYQIDVLSKDVMRDASNKDSQQRLISALSNYTNNAFRKLDNILKDPVLRPRLIGAYKDVVGVHGYHFRYTNDARSVDVYEGNYYSGEDADRELMDIFGKLQLLLKAVDRLAPESSPYATNKRTREAMFMLVNNLDKVLMPYINEDCTKSDRASHIADYLSLIDLWPADKTILNYLA